MRTHRRVPRPERAAGGRPRPLGAVGLAATTGGCARAGRLRTPRRLALDRHFVYYLSNCTCPPATCASGTGYNSAFSTLRPFPLLAAHLSQLFFLPCVPIAAVPVRSPSSWRPVTSHWLAAWSKAAFSPSQKRLASGARTSWRGHPTTTPPAIARRHVAGRRRPAAAHTARSSPSMRDSAHVRGRPPSRVGRDTSVTFASRLRTRRVPELSR